LVCSFSGNGNYTVSKTASGWHCNCPDHIFRNVECKHIKAVQFWLTLKEKLRKSETFEVETLKATRCKFCGSPDIIKYGKSGRKQVYKCKNCGRKFVPDDGFRKLRNDPRIISLTLDLYFKGVSLRKIADHLKQSMD